MRLYKDVSSFHALPDGYKADFRLDLTENKGLFVLINGLSILIALVLFSLGCLHTPLQLILEGSFWFIELRLLGTVLAMISYIFLHEGVHGVFIHYFSGKRAHYGFTKGCAYAGSQAYFAKGPYLVIALAPVVLWGLVFGVLCVLVPDEFFWALYALQIVNVAGAAGDLYVIWRFSRLPADILVQDTGVSMTVYTDEGEH